MGYSTDFSGEFVVTPAFKPDHEEYLAKFSSTRRMRRNAEIAAKFPDPVRGAVGLPIGEDGEYYVGTDKESFGQERDASVLDYNEPPGTQPGLWCQWVPGRTDDNEDCIKWNQGEKFYNYIEWIEYLIKNFLEPWGYKLNGNVKWRGEDFDDLGVIRIKDNEVVSRYQVVVSAAR